VRLGICTPYRHCESTQVALRIVQWAEECNIDVTIRSATTHPAVLGSPLDAEARKSRDVKFTDWAKGCTTIIWTGPPIAAQLKWAKKHCIYTVVFYLWASVDTANTSAMRNADAILTPTALLAHGMQRFCRSQKILGLPYDTGLPFIAKDPRMYSSSARWIFLPLYDEEPYKTESTVIEVLGRMLYRFDNTVLTVAYNASTIASHVKRRLKRFRKYFGRERVRQCRSPVFARRAELFQYHDLTVWPVHWEDTGIVGLTSMTMGTPVLSFYYPPLSEILRPTNSVSAQVNCYADASGLPHIEPNYQGMERVLTATLENEDTLPKLHKTVLHGLTERRKLFKNTLKRVMY